MADVDRCCICGIPVPEGRMVCPSCEKGNDFESSNFPIPLSIFVERFIGHNTTVILFDSNDKITQDFYSNNTVRKPVWIGMDWQIVNGYDFSVYYSSHPNVTKCPYAQCNVVKVSSTGSQFTDEIEITIDIIHKQKEREKEAETYAECSL